MSEAATTVPDNTKPWWRSRTLWFNLLLSVGMAVETQLALLKPLLGDATYAAFAITLIAGNAAMRTFTNQGLRL